MVCKLGSARPILSSAMRDIRLVLPFRTRSLPHSSPSLPLALAPLLACSLAPSLPPTLHPSIPPPLPPSPSPSPSLSNTLTRTFAGLSPYSICLTQLLCIKIYSLTRSSLTHMLTHSHLLSIPPISHTGPPRSIPLNPLLSSPCFPCPRHPPALHKTFVYSSLQSSSHIYSISSSSRRMT